MSEKVEIRSEDTVDKDFFSSLEEFYSGLDDSWSRFVPKQFQSSDYNPNTLTVTESVTGDAVVNVSCYKHVDSSKFFLGVIASST